MTDMEKDKEQDKRLNYIDIELATIKNVTHGSEVLQWDGIVKEHKKLEANVKCLKDNSDYVAKFFRGFMGAIKVVSSILVLVSLIYGVYEIFFH